MGVHWRVPDERPEGFDVTDPGHLDSACRVTAQLRRHGGPCELDAYGVEAARQLEAGGVVGCVHCGRPVLVPPDTCVGRVDVPEEEVHGVFDRLPGGGIRRIA